MSDARLSRLMRSGGLFLVVIGVLMYLVTRSAYSLSFLVVGLVLFGVAWSWARRTGGVR